MSTSTRWNLIVSRSTNHALCRLLASRGRDRNGALSHFVEAALQAPVLELRCVQPHALAQASRAVTLNNEYFSIS
jgi:Ribbon-helix-helix domain